MYGEDSGVATDVSEGAICMAGKDFAAIATKELDGGLMLISGFELHGLLVCLKRKKVLGGSDARTRRKDFYDWVFECLRFETEE